jgi:RNA polymerase sigma-70 factor (ECF subfamily)
MAILKRCNKRYRLFVYQVESMSQEDATLVKKALQGNREAFGILVDRYWRIISVLAFQKIGNAEDAEDIVQEAFYRAYTALDSLREPGKFASWLYNIAFRLCIDQLRKKGRRRRTSLDTLLDRNLQFPMEKEKAPTYAAETLERVLETIGTLPRRYGLVLTLRYLKGMSYREIADHLGEPPGTISNRLFRAHEKLRENLFHRHGMRFPERRETESRGPKQNKPNGGKGVDRGSP